MALARLATQLRVAGDLAEASRRLEEAITEAEAERDLMCWFSLRRAEILDVIGEREDAHHIAYDVLPKARAARLPLAVADALALSAALSAAAGELVDAIEQAAEAVGLLDGLADQPATAVVYTNLARTYGIADIDERAVAALERARRLIEPTDHVHETAACRANLGAAHVEWGLRLASAEQTDLARDRFVAATEPLLAALDAIERVPHPLVEARVRSRLALARAGRGEGRLVLTSARRATTLADKVGAVEERIVGRLAVGAALAQCGRADEAASLISEARDLARDRDFERWSTVALRQLAHVRESQHDAGAALAAWKELDVVRNGQHDRDRWLRLARFEERHLLERTRAAARDLRAENRQLSQMSVEDALTGLPNRWFLRGQLTPRLDILASRGARLCVGLIDVDDFKAINDTRSYAVGDRVLQQVARLLQISCRDQDVVVRWGGDEFLVFLPETTAEEAEAVGARFRSAVAEHPWNDVELGRGVTVSGGLAVGQAALGLDALMAAANRYLHQSKSAAKNTITVGAA